MRSGLTTLGIIIGVSSVITMIAVGEGARSEVERQIANLGANVLQVQPGSSRVRGRWAGSGTRLPLSEGDIVAIKEKVQGVEAISGNLASVAQAVSGNSNWLTSIEGVGEDYLKVRGWSVSLGRYFNESDTRVASKVAVLGATVSDRLFGDQDPIGQTVRVLNIPFEIVGLLEKKGQSNSGRDLDDVILIPTSTARLTIATKNKLVPYQVGNLLIKAEDDMSTATVKSEVEDILRKRRRIGAGAEDDFFVRDLAQYVRTRTEAQNTLGLLLAATAAVALIVGGIGIMNIMLVSVSERTREVGLRIAVGAQPRDILRQFLTEAVTLCLIGGMIGVIVGFAASLAIANWAAWPVLIRPETVVLALAAAAGTGICFGYLPARRAAMLDPIEALRRE
jgi:putative ABC transport system permease protein